LKGTTFCRTIFRSRLFSSTTDPREAAVEAEVAPEDLAEAADEEADPVDAVADAADPAAGAVADPRDAKTPPSSLRLYIHSYLVQKPRLERILYFCCISSLLVCHVRLKSK
jgi:hypothetical protein